MKKSVTYSLAGILLFFLAACARIGSPPGGDKDVEAPKVVETIPANFSTHYSQKKVEITFDEFVTLEKPVNEFIISPPLEKKPIPQLRGKSIVVELPASQLDSVTYTLDFGQAIKDNNEGNRLPNYQFILSTTNYIDSFSVSGILVDDFSLQPDKEAYFVCLYSNQNDTAPVKTIPSYLARTNSLGEFSINHISPGSYKVFALKDANNNMKYDLPTEKIAFLDQPVVLSADSFKMNESSVESTLADSLNTSDSIKRKTSAFFVEKDTASRDSLTHFKLYGCSVNLYAFMPDEPYKQYLVDFSRSTAERFSMIFNESLDKPVTPILINPGNRTDWYLPEPNGTNDTLAFWIKDSTLITNDSLVIEVTYPYTDTTGTIVTKIDTLLLKGKKEETKERKRETRIAGNLLNLKENDEKEADTLPQPPARMSISHNLNSSAQDLNAPVWITAGSPVNEFHPEMIALTWMDDTIERPARFTTYRDSSSMRRFRIDINFEPNATYKLKFFEGAFLDIYSRTIDTTVFSFTTQRDDYYGTLKMKMTSIETPLILQLLDKEEKKIVRQLTIDGDQAIELKYLHPGTYKFKIIYDTNRNGKWDTGDYTKKLQPEKVLYFPQPIEIKSNWDVEYEWEIIP